MWKSLQLWPKKGKVVDIKQASIGWNRTKAAICYPENSFFKNLPQQQQLTSYSYQRILPLVKFLNNTCLRSDFSAQLLSKLNNFPIDGNDVQLQ